MYGRIFLHLPHKVELIASKKLPVLFGGYQKGLLFLTIWSADGYGIKILDRLLFQAALHVKRNAIADRLR